MAMQLNKDNFEQEILKTPGVALVDFWAEWCGPCRMLAPVIDELSKDFEGKAKVGKVNVDESGELAQQYGIMSIPTVIVFKDGQPVEQMVGLQTKDKFAEKLNSHLG